MNDVVHWLLGSDPAIRWQVLRDLTGADAAAIAAERARVAREGLGAALLADQGADGAWHRDGEPDWVPTLHTAAMLLALGADPLDPIVERAMARLATGFRWAEELGAKPFFEGETEPCINGRALALGASYGHPSETLAQRLLADQLDDGGWNCDAPKSARSSFHSTICVLEGLLAYERTRPDVEVAAARRRGETYLLERAMFRRRSTGAVADPSFLTFAFPTRYYYDVLRGLDHLRDAEVAPDERIADAVGVIEHRRRADGTWPLDAAHAAGLAVPWPEAVGEPSRWITLRALRVLRWAGH